MESPIDNLPPEVPATASARIIWQPAVILVAGYAPRARVARLHQLHHHCLAATCSSRMATRGRQRDVARAAVGTLRSRHRGPHWYQPPTLLVQFSSTFPDAPNHMCIEPVCGTATLNQIRTTKTYHRDLCLNLAFFGNEAIVVDLGRGYAKFGRAGIESLLNPTPEVLQICQVDDHMPCSSFHFSRLECISLNQLKRIAVVILSMITLFYSSVLHMEFFTRPCLRGLERCSWLPVPAL